MNDSREFLISFYLGKIEQTDDEKLRARYIRRRDELEKELFKARTLDMEKWQVTYKDMLTKDEYTIPKAQTFVFNSVDPSLFQTITGMSIDIITLPPKYPLLRALLEECDVDYVISNKTVTTIYADELDGAVGAELEELRKAGKILSWGYTGSRKSHYWVYASDELDNLLD